MPEVRYWRIRMKVAGWRDQSEAAWDRGEVGVWYGAWTADDWRDAYRVNPNDPWSILRDLPEQQDLGWDFTPDLGAIQRFANIESKDWIIVFLRKRGEIGLARLDSLLASDLEHPLNEKSDNGSMEVFKFRKISFCKTFKIAKLPDAYRLLPAQGRGNVHEFHGMRGHVRLLTEANDESSLRSMLSAMSFDELIDILGASAWESVCTAYLSLEHGFVPTGLSTGFTLPVFDIIGRRVPDGAHILAQCKKTPASVNIDPEFISATADYSSPHRVFYFAFSGCHGEIPLNVEVIGRSEILAWSRTERGSMYRRFLCGD